MSFTTINPTTGQAIKTYNETSEDESNHIILEVHKTYLQWRTFSFEDRAKPMHKMAELLIDNKQDLAKIITQEMGKPIKQAIAEIEKCAWACNHFASNAQEYLRTKIIKTEMHKSFVCYKPLGVIFAIMPWNFPFWQVIRFAAPSLMAGNAIVLKHAPISIGAALAIEKLMVDAGFPINLLRTVILGNEGAAKVIKNPHIIGVTLTGSPKAGKSVSSEAGQVLKKVVLELGGSDPYIILKDADLELAAEACVNSRLNNSGQVCIAAKRLIMVDAIAEEFKELVKSKVHQFKMGNPMDETTTLGPMARADLREQVHKQVLLSIDKGAKLISGGQIPATEGFFYPPTLLDNVHKGMPAFDEEIFGPVIAFVQAKDEKEAIAIANDTPYGLAAAVFTKDLERGEKIATQYIEAGSCAVNTFVSSDPRLPFGGIKESGYGRELEGEGIRSFTNIKTILIK